MNRKRTIWMSLILVPFLFACGNGSSQPIIPPASQYANQTILGLWSGSSPSSNGTIDRNILVEGNKISVQTICRLSTGEVIDAGYAYISAYVTGNSVTFNQNASYTMYLNGKSCSYQIQAGSITFDMVGTKAQVKNNTTAWGEFNKR